MAVLIKLQKMDKTNNTIAILMATYNGETYLREQIDSILGQTYQDWHLYIHDDGSTDNTLNICKEFEAKYSSQITILDYPKQGGACWNFFSMLERVEAQYYMFSDQDDVWCNKKIESEMEQMYVSETDKRTPVIVFTDLKVVDSQLHQISESFTRFSCIFPTFLNASFNHLGAANMITGCTMLFNDAAKTCIQRPFTHATMHDAWIALCVKKVGGVISFISEPFVFYRQHNDNQVGASDVSSHGFIYRVKNIKELYRNNKEHFLMLKNLGYGSVFKYLYYKIKYKCFKIANNHP